MKYSRQIIPAAGLVGTMTIAAYMVVQLDSQTQQTTADFTNAKIGEVRDAQGAVILRGQFAVVDEQDDDVERKAPLQATGVDPDATGEAEIEHSKATPAEQEIEFSVRNLQPGSTVAFVIDGTEVGTATVDRRGRAEVEVDIRLPGAAAR